MPLQMLTVPEAAKRAGRDPETVRRWIRAGKLRARRVGTQHIIEEDDLDALTSKGSLTLPLPKEWKRTIGGQPQLDWASAVRESRRGR